MRWTSGLSQYVSRLLFQEWKKGEWVEWKAGEKEIAGHIHHILTADLNKEKEVEKEVEKMLDDLEKTHTGQFERYKMYPLLKRKIAEKKGVVL